MNDERKFWDEITMKVPRTLRLAAIEAGRKHYMTGEEFCRHALIQAVEAEGHSLSRKRPKQQHA